MLDHMINFWSGHVLLANFAHAAGGFGLAVILQYYIGKTSFIPVVIGWLLLAFAVGAHLYAYTYS
jgi:hypothetical protein